MPPIIEGNEIFAVQRAVPEGNELVGNLVEVAVFDALVVLVLVRVEFAAVRKGAI